MDVGCEHNFIAVSNRFWLGLGRSSATNLNRKSAGHKNCAQRQNGRNHGLFFRKQAAAPEKISAAIIHQLGGRDMYLPAQSPADNASAAQSRGCRAEIWFRLSLPKSKVCAKQLAR